MARPAKFTREQLVRALEQADGDLTRAAVTLGVSPSTVYRGMDRYKVEVRQTREVISVPA